MNAFRSAAALRTFGENLARFFLPSNCIVCNEELRLGQRLVCPICWERMSDIPPTECPFCWVQNERPSCSCLEFRQTRLSSVLSGWLYQGAVREVVHQIKYGRKQKFGFDAGIRLARKIGAHMPSADFAVSVPSHPARVRERGYSQAFVIAQGFCRETRMPFRADLLRRAKWTSSQTTHDRETRAQNIKDNFSVPPNLWGEIKERSILLIDDVFTTGATLTECARVFLECGAGRIFAVTLARVPELRQPAGGMN